MLLIKIKLIKILFAQVWNGMNEDNQESIKG